MVSKPGEVLSGTPHFKEIPGGRYAALAYEGTGADIGIAWNALLREWLPKSGHQKRPGVNYEIYLNTPGEVPKEQLRTELYVPLA